MFSRFALGRILLVLNPISTASNFESDVIEDLTEQINSSEKILFEASAL